MSRLRISCQTQSELRFPGMIYNSAVRRKPLSILQLALAASVFAVLISACMPAETRPAATLVQLATNTVMSDSSAGTATEPIAPPSATQPPSPVPSLFPSPTSPRPATVSPYAGLTVQDLSMRSFGGGQIQQEDTLSINAGFTRYLITYPSDGLTIYGFMNIPDGEGPFPVVIAIHGYIDPGVYETLDYTTRYADALSRAGYIVLHPNLRGYPPSNSGPNTFRVGMAIDVLNLVKLVEERAGQAGPLERAMADSIGLWGHSMGGGITIRAITVYPEIDAALLYGSMSGDEQANFEKILEWSEGARGRLELSVPEEDLRQISPIHHLERVQSAVSVHHGEADQLVPPSWSEDLCDRLTTLQKSVECFFYPGQPHTFFGENDQMFIERMIAFFDRTLKSA